MRILRKLLPLISSTISLLAYSFTIAPSVMGGNSGSLAAVEFRLGIARPGGHPLFAMLGYWFLSLPFKENKIYLANLLSAIYCAAAVGFFTLTALFLLDWVQNEKENKKPNITEGAKLWAAFLSSMMFAFSRTFWAQATSAGLYSLQMLLTCIALLLLLRAFHNDHGKETKEDSLGWLAFSAAYALCFTNQMSAVLLLPGAALLFFIKEGFSLRTLKKLLYSAGIFFAVIAAVYSYIPLRAPAQSGLSWENPGDFFFLFRQVFDIKPSQFSGIDAASKGFDMFTERLPLEFAYFGLLFSAAGLFRTSLHLKNFFYFNAITLVFAVAYGVNYNGRAPYFLIAFLSLGLFSVSAFEFCASTLGSKNRLKYIAVLLAVPVGYQAYFNFTSNDRKSDFVFDDYARALLLSTDPGSIILTGQEECFASSACYFQQVEGLRTDVSVLNKTMLGRDWYFNQIRTSDSRLYGSLWDLKFNNDKNALQKLVERNLQKRSIYLGPELIHSIEAPPGFRLVPDLFLYKVVRDTGYSSLNLSNYRIRIPQQTDENSDLIRTLVPRMLASRALYELDYHYRSRATMLAKEINRGYPDFVLPPTLDDLLL